MESFLELARGDKEIVEEAIREVKELNDSIEEFTSKIKYDIENRIEFLYFFKYR